MEFQRVLILCARIPLLGEWVGCIDWVSESIAWKLNKQHGDLCAHYRTCILSNIRHGAFCIALIAATITEESCVV